MWFRFYIVLFIFLLQLRTVWAQDTRSPERNTTLQLALAETEADEQLKGEHFKKFGTHFMVQDNKDYRQKMIVKPEELGKLDDFITGAVQKGAFPGCQILALKNGQVIFRKNYGYFTYGTNSRVTDSTLYDIASVSKIVGTTLAVMKLVEDGKLNLNVPLRTYLDNLSGTDKANILVRDLLLHQAGLKAWIPFYKNTLDDDSKRPRVDLYRNVAERDYNLVVAKRLYLKNAYMETVWEEILNSPLTRGRYVYSDLDFYFLHKIVEDLTGQKLDEYLATNFYGPLGLRNTMYNPWKSGLTEQCAPTESDDYFRYQTIQGYVHDPGAAMNGGVAGHAGLFSTASDLAVVMQMLLNGGYYNGKRYFKPETVELFTDYNSKISRRGLGFDKPDKEKGDGGPASELSSKSAFGHQGFTGTCAWADPETGIVFIFLSNRVFPTAKNKLINSMSVRTVAQSYVYKALGYER